MDPEPKVIVDEELKRTMAMIRDRFNTIKILQRNFDTCVEAAKSNQGLFFILISIIVNFKHFDNSEKNF